MRRLFTFRILAVTIMGALVLSAASACQDRSPGRGAAAPLDDPLESFTGLLQSGIMAIGGETTGWRLVGDGETGGIEVDVSRVRDRAQRYDGRRVTVTGRMIDHDYVERGKVRILVAERIEPVREGGE